MLTKMKIALVVAGSLISGVAAAQGTQAPRHVKKQEMIAKFDTNKNGTLEPAERIAMKDQLVLDRFKKLDTDGNGVLSLAEFKAGKHTKLGKPGKPGKRHARGLRVRGTRALPADLLAQADRSARLLLRRRHHARPRALAQRRHAAGHGTHHRVRICRRVRGRRGLRPSGGTERQDRLLRH